MHSWKFECESCKEKFMEEQLVQSHQTLLGHEGIVVLGSIKYYPKGMSFQFYSNEKFASNFISFSRRDESSRLCCCWDRAGCWRRWRSGSRVPRMSKAIYFYQNVDGTIQNACSFGFCNDVISGARQSSPRRIEPIQVHPVCQRIPLS